ncbi:MAG: SAM-dependent methyltransferase, partial [Proteobacteria bacterium]|nr:SAM-dependent methyltransferase [Pseudomonadota bacterium]
MVRLSCLPAGPGRNVTPLAARLIARMRAQGALTVQQYMEACLGDPEHGYYMTRDPLGRAGDFITAPEISQMFGELIGLWVAHQWRAMGAPATVHLIELGPGRGTLMADALRAARGVPEFLAAAQVHLIEISPVLKAKQELALKDAGATWCRDLSQVPTGPAIVIGNEFLDALPIRQLIKTPDGWRERSIELDDAGRGFRFGTGGERVDKFVPAAFRDAAPGAIFEVSPVAGRIVHTLAARLAADGGAALLIDYGHAESALGETLQALSGHAFADPRADLGEHDLTAHVDFAALVG